MIGRKRRIAARRIASTVEQMVVALGHDGEVDHHDAVLLHDADEQDDADERDEAELVMEQHQHRDRAHAGRGKRRENRDRMDVALVENAENEIDHDERREDQERHRRERILEGLGISLEARDDRAWQFQIGFDALDGVRRLAERRALREVEADGDRRELSLVADRQGLNRRRRPFCEGRKRHLPAGRRRAQEDLVERRRVALQRRQHLHDHVIARELREILADLALAEGIIKRVVDELRA